MHRIVIPNGAIVAAILLGLTGWAAAQGADEPREEKPPQAQSEQEKDGKAAQDRPAGQSTQGGSEAERPPAQAEGQDARQPDQAEGETEQPDQAEGETEQPDQAEGETEQPDQAEGKTEQPDQAEGQPGGDETEAGVSLQAEQETEVREAIVRTQVEPVTDISISVGATVPRSVTLHELPPAVIEVVPQYRGYRYIVVEQQIVIIEPEAYRVVHVIPIGGGSGRLAAACTDTIELTRQQRVLIRERVLDAHASIRGPGFRLEIGERLPTGVRLHRFPATVVEEVTVVRPCNYVVIEDEIVLVDPDQRRIVAVID